MDRADRTNRLSALVAQARQLRELGQPTTAYLLRVLDALTVEEIAVLGRWQLGDERGEAAVDRLTKLLAEPRQVIRQVLSDCLRLDVWGDYDREYSSARQRYEESGETAMSVETSLGRPPQTYSFLLHGCIQQWQPQHDDLSDLIIEDDDWWEICRGCLVVQGKVFSSTLALMETCRREEWEGWRKLWKWF
jgi:hypothetical protein